MTKHPELFAALAAPFGPGEVKQFQKSGKVIRYITARTVMNRLDMVIGPENWWARFEVASADSVLCYLSLRLPDGAEVTKSDVGGCAGMADAGDDDKSAASDGLKRAAVQWGVGRELYRDGVANFTPAAPGPSTDAPPTDLGWVHNAQKPIPAPEPSRGNGKAHDGPPRTGRALYAWAKEREQEYEVGLLKSLEQWAKLQGFPGRVIDWGPDQVALAVAEANRKLATLSLSREAVAP